MPALFNFEVYTPQRLFFSAQVQAIIVNLADGEIAIYANHSPFAALSVTGLLRIKDENGAWRSAFISGGVLQVKEHKDVLMTESAEWPEEIDMERALESKRQAEAALQDAFVKFEIDRAKEKLRKAELRLSVIKTEKQKRNVDSRR
jgi:F-type H+-transporting ATPase subunit epsilon